MKRTFIIIDPERSDEEIASLQNLKVKFGDCVNVHILKETRPELVFLEVYKKVILPDEDYSNSLVLYKGNPHKMQMLDNLPCERLELNWFMHSLQHAVPGGDDKYNKNLISIIFNTSLEGIIKS